MKPGDKCIVVWVDPQTSPGWFETEEMDRLEPIETIGFFVREDNTTLWLATTHYGTEEFCDQLIFPKGCIVNVILL